VAVDPKRTAVGLIEYQNGILAGVVDSTAFVKGEWPPTLWARR
jgi:hypothetical protein